MTRFSLKLLLAAATLAPVAACNTCRRATLVPTAPPAPAPAALPAPPSTYYSPGGPVPPAQPSMIDGDPLPPRHVPAAPAAPPAAAAYPPQDYGGFVPPPAVRRQQGACPAPAPGIQSQQGYFLPAPPSEPGAAGPARPGVVLAPPEPTPPPPGAGAAPPSSTLPSATDPWPAQPAPPGNGARLYPPQPPASPPAVIDQPGPQKVPQTQEPPQVKDQAGPPPGGDRTREPPVQRPTDGTPPLPVDIGHFAQARPNVANGQQPLPDGLPWLKKRGYQAVLYIRPPGSADTAARRLIEQAGLRYLSLEVSPQTLSKEIVDRFNQLVTSPANQPLFVYDDDGSLAGGLWYLHYRLIEKKSPEEALAAAARLGFSDKTNVDMWLAVQKYLGQQKP